jgi:hypothetical protein
MTQTRYKEALSNNQCCREKKKNIMYSEYVFVALVIQYTKRMRRYVVSCGLSGLNFLDRFSKNIQISNLKKILPVGTELFRADRGTDGQTDMRKLIVAFFFNFANAPDKELS